MRPFEHHADEAAHGLRLDIAVRLPGKPTVMSLIDVSTTYPLGINNVVASRTRGADAAAEMAAAAKTAKYGPYIDKRSQELVPIIFDLLGGMNVAGRKMLRDVFRRWGAEFQLHGAVAARICNHRLSFQLAREVAKLVLNNAISQLPPPASTQAAAAFA